MVSSEIGNCLLHLLLFLCHTLPHIVRFVLLLLKKSLFQLGSFLLSVFWRRLLQNYFVELYCSEVRLKHLGLRHFVIIGSR